MGHRSNVYLVENFEVVSIHESESFMLVVSAIVESKLVNSF